MVEELKSPARCREMVVTRDGRRHGRGGRDMEGRGNLDKADHFWETRERERMKEKGK